MLKKCIGSETASLAWLGNVAPCFGVHATSVSVLNSPNDFFSALAHSCRRARRRLTLASLYVGNTQMERRLVDELLQNERLADLQINVLLDYARANRFANNSRSMLLPVLKKAKNCTLSLYHTPMLRGVCKKVVPNRWNELFGVQHMKLYICDDELIISGANLSVDYFSNRIDRYYVIRSTALCDFYDGLVRRVQEFSVRVDGDNAEVASPMGCAYAGNNADFVRKAGDSIKEYLQTSMMVEQKEAMNAFDTWVFPLVQMGPLGVHQDQKVMNRLFADAPEDSRLNIATAYFNLTGNYVRSLIYKSQAECELLLAHPKANGFLGAKGMAGGIPWGYLLLARRFEEELRRSGQGERIRLWEYLREGWTYHAKGLWYYAPGRQLPCLTLIGSSNFGNRSVAKDLETQVAIVTSSPRLQELMQDEWERLYKCGVRGDFQAKVPYWVHAAVFLFKDFF